MLKLQNEISSQPAGFKEAVLEFERKCNAHKVALHGFLVLKGNSIIAENYNFPYSETSNHRMYSITKSLTSIAIGILISEGKLCLSDKIYTFFESKYDLKDIHPYLKELTIENMLTMQTCFYKTTYDENSDYDWAVSYFTKQPDHKPGTVFSYDTSSSQVLAALVEMMTGMSLLDFLKIKLFNELGLSNNIMMLTDPSGVAQGGTGFICTLRDLAKIAYCLNNRGLVNGKQLIPADYLEKATSKMTPTSIISSSCEETLGYGYMIWKARDDGFVMYGMGGQLAICFPKLDLCMLTIADTIGYNYGLQCLYDCFYDTIYKYIKPEYTSDNNMVVSANVYATGRFEVEYRHNIFKSIQLTDDLLILHRNDGSSSYFKYDLNNSIRFYKEDISRECCSYSFCEDGHLIIKCFVTDIEQGHMFFDIYSKDDYITLRMESTSAQILNDFKGCISAKKENK